MQKIIIYIDKEHATVIAQNPFKISEYFPVKEYEDAKRIGDVYPKVVNGIPGWYVAVDGAEIGPYKTREEAIKQELQFIFSKLLDSAVT